MIDTHAYMPPPQALSELTEEEATRRFPGINHSIAEILAHMTFWQDWFLKRLQGVPEPFITSASLGWPDVKDGDWNRIHDRFVAGLEEAAAFASQTPELERPIQPALEFEPMANYTVREALVHMANHNSYHLGQIVILRQLAGAWPPSTGSWTW